jgi:hypothetical protein
VKMSKKPDYSKIYTFDNKPASNFMIVDTATPFLKKVAAENPSYLRRAVRHTGWWLQKSIKYEIRQGIPGGKPYTPFSKLKNVRSETEIVFLNRISKKTGKQKQIRRRVGASRLVRETTHKPLGKLANAVGYKFYPDSIRSVVGWLSLSAQSVGTKMEKGYTINVTPKMKRMYAASGFPLNKSQIDVPARPTFDPIFKEKSGQIVQHLEKRVWQYIEQAGAKS